MQYVELRCRSNFTFLHGASHPSELVTQAAELGYRGIAITDHASFAGVVRGFVPAQETGIQYIVGTEVHPVDGLPMVLWPTNRAAYGRLCRLISRGRTRAAKGACELSWADIRELSEGVMAGVLPSTKPVAAQGSGSATATSPTTAPFTLGMFREVFGEAGSLLCEVHREAGDASKITRLRQLSQRYRLPLVASGDVCYHAPHRSLLQDCVTAIRHGTTIDQVHQERFSNAQRHLRSRDEIAELYRSIPEAIERTVEIADSCKFTLDQLRYEYPTEIAPPGMSPVEHLKRLVWEGAKQRWPDGVPQHVIDLLRHEIDLITELKYEAYFLTVWDMVRFARSRGILCQGRGSAANSAVCFCLGITSVDPTQNDLLFERFVSRERNEAPDIDVDFEHQRREEVLQYLYAKYGRERAGMTAVVTSYRSRSAIREVGKTLGMSADAIEALAKGVGSAGHSPDLVQRCQNAGFDPKSETGKRFVFLVSNLVGFPRHLSQHVGGMVMTSGPLCELCPIENAAMEARSVIQWNKDDLDEIGILKVDVLSLGMLTAIRRCFTLIEQHHGIELSLSTIPHDDEATYRMIRRADTIGVFQIESRAQMSMLPRLKPACFYDIVIQVAIVRPGPIQGDMVHPFLAARKDPSLAVYPNDAIRGVLEKTLGVPLFQEQAMRLAVVAAGFTPGEADQLRRAMAAWRRPGVIDELREKLLAGMQNTGLDAHFAEHVFNQIRGFGEYGFPESHAVSFALLAYASSYLKAHYPAAFCAALLNSQPMGFYAPAQLVNDAREHGVCVRAVCVNHSDWESTLEPDQPNKGPALRLGLSRIQGFRGDVAERIVAARQTGGPFQSIRDLGRRTGVGAAVIATLADADALASLAGDRRAAIWESLAQDSDPDARPLLGEPEEQIPGSLRSMTAPEEVQADYLSTGMSLKAHPISFLREALEKQGCQKIAALAQTSNNRPVRIAGAVLLRQRPGTAKGVTFATLEDETGKANVVIFATTWKRFFRIAKASNAWIVDGKLERKESVLHVIVAEIRDLQNEIDGLRFKSRDFH